MSESRVTDLSSGISPVGPSKKVKAAIRKAVKKIGEYPDPQASRLRKSMSSKFGVTPESFLFANSIRELIYLTASVLRPRNVLVSGPGLPVYEMASEAAGARVSYLHPDEGSGFLPDPQEIIRQIRGKDLLIIASPNRVTGRLAGRDDLEDIVRHAISENVSVLLDESLIEFTEDDSFPIAAGREDRLIVIRTSALFYGLAGLELAYAVSSPATAGELRKRSQWEVNTLSVAAAQAALRDKTYCNMARRYVSDERQSLVRSLAKLGCVKTYPSDSNMLLIRWECRGREIMPALARAGFMLSDCSDICGLDQSFLRLSVSEHDRNRKLLRIIRGCLSGMGDLEAPV
ncbi:MAG: aminotransferase class I/II-fold pyridoxal phosphate-dependent enzyme [Nitrospirae bacterium]|nr:aminotransferase class I/II-fold pyridoxal phosphate-dependent enzyme [Nitrospirota bacterium]